MQNNLTTTINGYQLSPQQKRLWWLQQQEATSQTYRVQCAVSIEGNINYPTLEKALHKIVAKHEILRTSFQTLKGMDIPLQVIEDETKYSIIYHDFTNEVNVKTDNLFQENELSNDNVLNIHVISISPCKHILLIVVPAICLDAISIHNVVSEISEAYTACLNHQELLEQPLQYADIAAWQNELFEAEDGQVARKYWHQKNITNLGFSNLPNEKYSSDRLEFQPKLISVNFNNDTVAKIKHLAKNHNISVSTILLAGWQILLGRLTEQSEINIATCYDGRNYEELKTAIGLLAKYIPVGISLENNYNFTEIIKQLETNIKEVEQWQDSFSWDF